MHDHLCQILCYWFCKRLGQPLTTVLICVSLLFLSKAFIHGAWAGLSPQEPGSPRSSSTANLSRWNLFPNFVLGYLLGYVPLVLLVTYLSFVYYVLPFEWTDGLQWNVQSGQIFRLCLQQLDHHGWVLRFRTHILIRGTCLQETAAKRQMCFAGAAHLFIINLT